VGVGWVNGMRSVAVRQGRQAFTSDPAGNTIELHQRT